MPKLRFPQFEGEWQTIPFSELFEILSNNTLSRAELSDNGEIKNLHYGDVLIKYGDTLDLSNTDIPYISHYSLAKRNDVFLTDGDVIIADTAEDETVGKATELYNVNNQQAVSGLHTIPCRPRNSFVSKYLGFYLNSPHYHKQLISLMQGVKVLSISKSNIATTNINYPSESEQKKIVGTLALLDKRIAKQRELVESLKSYKRGLLSRLFPQNGESVPRLRFSEFTEDWDSYSLSSLGEFFGGGTPDKSVEEFWLGDVAWISSSDLNDESIDEINISRFITETAIENSATKICPVGTIHIVSRVGVGKVAISTKSECTSQDFCNFINLTDNYTRFIAYQLKVIMEYKASQTQGTSIKGITVSEIKEIVIKIPKKKEQLMIIKVLSDIDRQISKVAFVYEELCLLKNNLLQKMFI